MPRTTRKDVNNAVDRFNRIHGDHLGAKLTCHYENEGLVIELERGKLTKRLARNLSAREAMDVINALDEFQNVYTFALVENH
jgi:hypothetical protein